MPVIWFQNLELWLEPREYNKLSFLEAFPWLIVSFDLRRLLLNCYYFSVSKKKGANLSNNLQICVGLLTSKNPLMCQQK